MTEGKDNWEIKSDAWLLQALCSADVDDQNRSINQLQHRYGWQVTKRVHAKLPPEWVEEVMQEIWQGFYRSVRSNQGNISNVGSYLNRITQHRIADAVERLTRERSIEYGGGPSKDEIDIEELGETLSAEEDVMRDEELAVARTQLEFVQLVPFVDAVLSDCQRVLWLLTRLLDYPQTVVSRLMGKNYGTIRSEYRHARNRVLRYFRSAEFGYLLQESQLPKSLRFEPQREASVVVERFAEMTTPYLTPDELKPLGLTPAEFEQEYVASLIMPRWFKTQSQMELNLPSLLLTRRTQWSDLGVHLQKLHQGMKNTDYTPLECLIHFSIEDDNIILEPASLVEMLPELDPPGWTDNTFVTAHAPRMTVPVIWGFWDESMANEDEVKQEYVHWPFMKSLGGDWVDLRGEQEE